ncbi:MAG TPA: alpha/beta hydrolase [Kribbellaceae bacterium]|jgi:pimeloyl-ACP methyl ester carboxylesterase
MGAALHHVEFGDGTPVLAIHGWTPDHRMMTGCLEPVFERRSGYRRLYPDLPAMGRTPADGVSSSDDIMAALLDFVDAEVGTAPFLLIGDSYGGYLARGVVAQRPDQVLGLTLICPVGTELDNAERVVPEHVVLHAEPGILDTLTPDEAEDFAGIAVVQTAETLRQYAADIMPGLATADLDAMSRIRASWALSTAPESGPVYERPALIVCGRQDSVTGYAEQFTFLPHYPRASYVVLDRAGHNLQIEQAPLFQALVGDWLDRVAEVGAARFSA